MAISKRRKRAQQQRPDAEAFVRVLDGGLADEVDVIRAYEHALSQSTVRQTSTELLQEALADDGLAKERPAGDPKSAEARLINLHRHYTFKDGHPAKKEDQ
jgi:hypothetical protein